MDQTALIQQAERSFQSAFDYLQTELSRLRTGRANTAMLEGITVEAYGTQMPLQQTGTITVLDAQMLQVTPFDINNLQAIVAAIRNQQTLGFNPSDDGRVVRVAVPPLTEERRRDIAKQIGDKLEEALVRMRNARHDIMKQLDAAKKDKQLGEDDWHRLEKTVEDLLAKHKKQMEMTAQAKEQEIMKL